MGWWTKSSSRPRRKNSATIPTCAVSLAPALGGLAISNNTMERDYQSIRVFLRKSAGFPIPQKSPL